MKCSALVDALGAVAGPRRHDRFRRVFQAISPSAWQACLIEWLSGGFTFASHIGSDDRILTQQRHGEPIQQGRFWIALWSCKRVQSSWNATCNTQCNLFSICFPVGRARHIVAGSCLGLACLTKGTALLVLAAWVCRPCA